MRATVQTGSVGTAPLELVWAVPGSPAFAMYGCRAGEHFLHHIAYRVENFEAESRHLTAAGFAREVLCTENGRFVFAYHKSRTGIRIELYPAETGDS